MTTSSGFIAVPLPQIADNPFQPRSSYDPEHILKLALSIKRLKNSLPATQGLQQVPLARLAILQRDGTVEAAQPNLYLNGRAERAINEERNTLAQLMFGHSRFRALRLLNDGLRYTLKYDTMCKFSAVPEVETIYADLLDPDLDYATMPVMLGYADDQAMWKHAITENSQRKNITAIDEAHSIKRAIEELGLTTEEAGKPFGYARSTTANKLRLLDLPTDIQKLMADGAIPERHGRELLRLADDPERVSRVAETLIKNGMTVKRLAETVKWEEDALKKEQQKAAELAAVRAALAAGWRSADSGQLGADRVTDLPSWKINEFVNDTESHVALLQHGKCGGHCPCLVVGYSETHTDRMFRPDPDNAPHCGLGCSDYAARQLKMLALGDLALTSAERERQKTQAERKERAAQLNNKAHQVWQQWVKQQDKHALWNDIAFWKQLFSVGRWQVEAIVAKADSAPTACTELLKLLYQGTRTWDDEVRDHVHTVEEVNKLIKALSGVSQETEGQGANGHTA